MEDINNNQNSRNFLAILKWLAETSKPLQGLSLIREINCASFFLILADEVKTHHVEQLPLCIRFVDDDDNIKEEFLEFGQCKWIDRKSIAEEILCILEKVGLNVNICWDQGYDGAANMSSEAVGIQGIIKNSSGKSVYTDCCRHNLVLFIFFLFFILH